MSRDLQPAAPGRSPDQAFRLLRSALVLAGAGVVVWLVLAYGLMPRLWRRYEARHPALAATPATTITVDGIPGDPINVGLVGSEAQLHRAMLAAGWFPADPITLKATLRITDSVVFKKPYPDGPVSSLYLWGRRQDLAFEQAVGEDVRQRHHVRFWRSARLDDQGRPLWMGAATFDTRVGLSYRTGEITHHIAAEVDADRDKVMADLKRVGALPSMYWVAAFNRVQNGRNGEGDPFHTDGQLAVGLLSDLGPIPGSPDPGHGSPSGQ